jgi:hypothetical protein
MKWLSNLFKRPTAKPVASTAQSTPAKPAALAPTAVPQAADPPAVWVGAICATADKQQALTWLVQLQDEVSLADVAMRARGGETRFAAAQRIASSALLERVAQHSRDKDKRVYRYCTDLLKQRQLAEKHATRAQAIGDELRQLLAAAPLPNTRLLDLNKELGCLAEAGEAGQACQALMQQALAQLHQESEALRDLHAQHKLALGFATECGQTEGGYPEWPWHEELADWQNRAASLRQAYTNLPSWLADQTAGRGLGTSLVTSLGVALDEIEARLASLAEVSERMLACEQWLGELEAGNQPAADAVAVWSAMAKPENAQLCAVLEARWQVLKPSPVVSEPVESAVDVQQEAEIEVAIKGVAEENMQEISEPVINETAKPSPRQPRFDPEVVVKLMDQLEQAIAEGHLVDAESAAKQIKTRLAGSGLHSSLESRLHRLHAELETLRGWARWGTAQAREKLIEDAQALLSGEQEVEALAVAISALRESWKRLNAHAAAPKAQWESFDAVLEKAYLPVAAHRAEQAVRHAESRALREALCADWEAAFPVIDGPQADFKAIETRRAEIIKQWHAAPQASFRDERLLRKRFDALIGGIDQQLDAARAAEYARREQLIAAAQALQEQPDLRQAMAEAKALQQRWSKEATPVRLKRNDDQKQWQRFRAACNLVFERLDAQRAEQTAQRQEQTQARQVLLDHFAASLEGADVEAVKRALTEFRATWGASRPSAREADDGLETRARDLQQQAQQRLDQVRQEKHQARFALLAQKATLAQRVEMAALSGHRLEAVLAEAQQAWDALARLPGASESMLAQRFAAAKHATEALLATGRNAREDLLLDLEISLGLPSPDKFATARRERQLGRLQNRFGAATEVQLEPEALLVRCYATPVASDAMDEQRLAAVAQKLAQQAEPMAASA